MDIDYSIPLEILVDSAGEPLQATPELAYGDCPSIVFTAFDAAHTAVELSSATTWIFTLNVDHSVSTPAVCEIPSTDITYNVTAKTLAFTLDTETTAFQAVVDGKSHVCLFAELSGYDSQNVRVFRFAWIMNGCSSADVPPDSDDLSIVSNLSVTIIGTEPMCASCCTSDGENNDAFGGTYAIVNTAAIGTARVWQRSGCCGYNQILFQSNHWVLLDSEGECAAYPVAVSEMTDGTVNPWNLFWYACNGETGTSYTATTVSISLQD